MCYQHVEIKANRTIQVTVRFKNSIKVPELSEESVKTVPEGFKQCVQVDFSKNISFI